MGYEELEKISTHSKKATNVKSEIPRILKLSENYFKAAIINIFQEVRVNTLAMNEKIESLNKDTKRNKIEMM